jgi:uncharacterized membrane protein
MAMFQETIDVNVPVRAAYDQWTQFEDFPRFMENVELVQQLDATTLRWRASIGGMEKEWQARITEQVPDRCIAWESTAGARNDGTVTFDRVGADLTRITLQLQVEPDGPVESAGATLGLVRQSVHRDLERFRDFIETRGVETGGWRGEIHDGARIRGPERSPGTVAFGSSARDGATGSGDTAAPGTSRRRS